MGSSNSLLRASANTQSADSDVLSEDSSDSKTDTYIVANNVNGLPGELVNIYATVYDITGTPVKSGTAMFSTNGQTHYSQLNNGLAIFYNVELPRVNSVEEIIFMEDDTYKGSSVFINLTVDTSIEDYYGGGSDYEPPEPSESDVDNETVNNDTSEPVKELSKSKSKLEKNTAANPIIVLILALITLCGTGIFKDRK